MNLKDYNKCKFEIACGIHKNVHRWKKLKIKTEKEKKKKIEEMEKSYDYILNLTYESGIIPNIEITLNGCPNYKEIIPTFTRHPYEHSYHGYRKMKSLGLTPIHFYLYCLYHKDIKTIYIDNTNYMDGLDIKYKLAPLGKKVMKNEKM